MFDIDKCLASEDRVEQRFADLEMTVARAAKRKSGSEESEKRR